MVSRYERTTSEMRNLHSSGVSRRRRAGSGFTLIEALVSLIMFAFIMGALSLAFSTVTKAQDNSEVRQNDNGNIRAIFDNLKRDIQGAYASVNDPQSVFIAGGTATGTGQNEVGSAGLLTFSTQNYTILASELSDGNAANSSTFQSGALAADPQSGVQIVRYDLDTGSYNLTRSVTTVPNLNLVNAPQVGDPATVIGSGVVSITFQYWDPIQTSWRTTWDYEQSNLATSTTGTGTGTTTGTGTASASTTLPGGLSSTPLSLQNSGQSTTAPDTSIDTYFPSAVQVTLVCRNSAGRDITYSETFTVVAGQPFTDPSSTTTTTTAAGG